MGLGPLSLYGAGSPINQWGWVPFHYMGLGPRPINGSGSPFIIWGWVPFNQWGWVPFQSMGLGPLSINGAGSPFSTWGWVPFQSMGLGPLSINGAGSPFIIWGWIPSYCVGLGLLAIEWREDLLQIPGSLEHPSAFYGAQHVWFCPTADPDLRGWVPFQAMGLGPLSISGLDPLLLCGAGSPCNRLAGGSIADTWLPRAPVRLLRRTACVVLSHC